jgi:putative flippase GtrA
LGTSDWALGEIQAQTLHADHRSLKGREIVNVTIQNISRRYTRPIRFGLVGLSGAVVNTGVLWGLVWGLGLPVLLASALATEAAILSNFLLNDRWTFRTAAHQGMVVQRLLRFNGVALGGMAITTAVLVALTTHGHLPLLFANLLAVGTAMAWNYVVNSRWTWGQRTEDRGQGTGDRGQPALSDGLSSVVGRRSSVVGEEVLI